MATSNPAKRKAEKDSASIPSKKIRGSYLYQKWSFPDSIIFYITKNPTSSKVGKNEWTTSLGKSDLTKIRCKLWITNTLDIKTKPSSENNLQNFLSILFPKLYRCDAKSLFFYYQTMFFNDICLLSSSVEDITLEHVIVKKEDDSITPFEKMIESCPIIIRITFSDHPSASFVSKKDNLFRIPHFKKLECFSYC